MLLFDVNGQTLKRADHFNPATDSLEYLKAKFTFNDSAWSGKTKTALFRLGTAVCKSVLGTDGTCKVPSEVLVGGESRVARIHGETIHVSLIGEYSTIRITTNEIAVKLNRSGYADAETPSDPTESEYQQMTAVAADAVAEAEEARTACENARADLVGVKNLFANAIKGNLSGAVVFADDVSPVEHNPVVKVHGKNLISYPHNNTTKTENGLTFTDNGDGSYTIVMPEGMGGDQWMGQVHFESTGLSTTADKKYDFQVVLVSSADHPGVTIKLSKAGDDNTFYCTDRHPLKAGKKFIYQLPAAAGIDIPDIKLSIDVAGGVAGSTLTVSDIVLREAVQ